MDSIFEIWVFSVGVGGSSSRFGLWFRGLRSGSRWVRIEDLVFRVWDLGFRV